jgi:hypothetical protein
MIWEDIVGLLQKLPGDAKSASFLPQCKMKLEAQAQTTAVVPAKAGTHTPEPLVMALSWLPFAKLHPVGPGGRGDDNEEMAVETRVLVLAA